jgi:hypothetical protein
MNEQVPANRLTTVQITDEQNKRALEFWADCETFPKMAARQIVYLTDQLTDLRASLRREENARKVLADENQRLLARWKETFEKGAILP